MTNEQINIAIAEVCGYKNVAARITEGTIKVITGFKNHTFDEEIPDYYNDLNAMHEAEKQMNTKVLWEAYKAHLLNWMTEPVCASARQRAEAFLKTINKWED